jgi:hypothetical protein
MNAQAVISALNAVWHFDSESRVDLEWTGEHTFRATEIRPDLSIGKRVVGYLSRSGGIISSQEPELSFEQAKVFQAVLRGFSERLLAGKTSGSSAFLLMKDGEYPELFHPLDFRPNNIAGNARDGMLPVWHAIEDLVQMHGYRVFKMQRSGAPWELWAQPLNTPRV